MHASIPALLFSVAISAVATAARAEGITHADAKPHVDDVEVEIAARGEMLQVALYDPDAKPGRDRPVLRCGTPCRARLARGEYRLAVRKTKRTADGDRLVRIDRDLGVLVEPSSLASRNIWGAVALLGTVAVLVGPVLLASSIPISCDDSSSHCSGSSEGAWTGFIMAVVGLPTAVIGWIGFAGTIGFDMELRPLYASPGIPTGSSTRIERQPTGAAFELRLSF